MKRPGIVLALVTLAIEQVIQKLTTEAANAIN